LPGDEEERDRCRYRNRGVDGEEDLRVKSEHRPPIDGHSHPPVQALNQFLALAHPAEIQLTELGVDEITDGVRHEEAGGDQPFHPSGGLGIREVEHGAVHQHLADSQQEIRADDP